MSANALSPTARILRTSRLFALPSPLKEAPLAPFGLKGEQHSNTATKPFPLHASIVTPKTSQQKGDWGLKRSLPRKLNRTSTPVIRVKAVDSWAHITEYESAADHTLTLEKFQELNLPVSAPQSRHTAQPMFADNNTTSRGVFDQNTHNTEASHKTVEGDRRRWKFSGPAVGTMGPGEFSEYLAREIEGREVEFREFLRARLAALPAPEDNNAIAQEGSGERARDAERSTVPRSTDNTSLNLYIEELRGDFKALALAVEEFLDLPPPFPSRLKNTPLISSELWASGGSNQFQQEFGPMRTHPAAGLSYLRSGAHMPNHPLLGPQQYPRPVVARVLTPASTTAYGRRVAQKVKLGVAGLVADDPATNSHNFSSSQRVTGLMQFEPDNAGGTKLYVHPKRAMIDSDGSVNLEVTRASSQTVGIRNGSAFDPASDAPAYRSLGGVQPQSMFPERTVTGIQNQRSGREDQSVPAGRPSRRHSALYKSLENVIDGAPLKR